MPSIHFQDNSPEGKARDEFIKSILPLEPITGPTIHDRILKATKTQALDMLRQT